MAKRLERAEGTANIELILARKSLFWGDPATYATIFGVDATYDGPDSPLSQTIGLGLFGRPSDALLDRLEQFFEERGAPVRHQISPLAGAEIAERLAARGFRPVALSNVLFCDMRVVWESKWSYDPSILVWEVWEHLEGERWLQFWADGPSSPIAGDEGTLDLLRTELRLPCAWRALALKDGMPVGGATACWFDDVMFIYREFAVPSAPLEEVRAALLKYLAADAVSQHCQLVMLATEPGSARQLCAENLGFRVAYTRTEWRRESRGTTSRTPAG